MHIYSKLPNVGTTIFTVMSALATEYNAVNLGQGFPDYNMSDDLISLVNEAMKNGFNQYVPMQGYLPLREALSEKIKFLYTTAVNPDTQITITPGGTYAIYTALTTILQPGDEVIVFEPAYDSYIPTVEVNGAVPVLIDLEFPEYKIDWNKVRQKISPKTRMILLNSPHNPTGSVLSADDLNELHSIVRDKNIFICSDEVYEHLIFDDIPHQSILRYPDLLEKSFVCFSFGKVFHCTGWKLGYCVSSPELTKEFRKVHQFNCFSWILVSSLRPKVLFVIQVTVCLLMLLLVTILNVWAFPLKNSFLIVFIILLLAVVFYFLKNQQLSNLPKTVCVSVASMVVSFFLLNTNFYPQLLKYQGGNELAKKIKGNVDPVNVYFWKENYSSSFNFYTATERKQFDDSIFQKGKNPIWLLFDKNDSVDIRQSGYKIGLIYSVPDFGITKLNLKFINPVTRKNELHEMMLGEITGKE